MLVPLYDRQIDLGPHPSSLVVQRWTGQLSPEPETVAWIESLPANAHFWDIGASVGTHAVRACVRGLHVTAFEPHEASFRDLTAVVDRNALAILCSNQALYDGSVDHGVIGRGRSKYTFLPNSYNGQLALATSLDHWVKDKHGHPEYIKLDVDGNEEKIIAGGEVTFRGVKSALIEVDPVVNPNIPDMMWDLGFRYDREQVASCLIREGKYKGTANYIFYR